jgi:hypothetical protein
METMRYLWPWMRAAGDRSLTICDLIIITVVVIVGVVVVDGRNPTVGSGIPCRTRRMR